MHSYQRFKGFRRNLLGRLRFLWKSVHSYDSLFVSRGCKKFRVMSCRTCATRREDEMKQRSITIDVSIAHIRWAMSLWVVAFAGCSADVKKLTLKGNREARCRPPRRGA